MKNKNKNNILSFPTSISKLERQVEAILFAASEPLDVETIEKRVQTNSDITKILNKIKDNYKNTLLYDFYHHDISKGPLKSHNLGEY